MATGPVDGENQVPSPAMAVLIKTRKRRVIEYVISPLLRCKAEGLRER